MLIVCTPPARPSQRRADGHAANRCIQGSRPNRWRWGAAWLAVLVPAAARAEPAVPPPAPQQPYPNYAPGPMQSGGLAPPPPMQSGGLTPPAGSSRPTGPWSPQSPTEAKLAEADASDSGRGLDFFYIDAEVGAAYLAPEAFHGPLFKAGSAQSGLGASVGAGFGVRFLYFTVGPHVRYAPFSSFRFLTVDLDLGWRVPLGRLEPYGILAAGYGNLGSDAEPGDTFFGYNVRVGGGVDDYLSNVLSVGGSLTAELVRLRRSNFPAVRTPNPDPALESGAYGLGIGVTLAGVLGLHF